ncbi:MAG: geranylgeranyl reductase [Candidatus Altiarchaeales archaeon]|nr:MAG: geranylgeranyl reductase [Candidatus Altiarchaeales archaeon]
MIYDVVVVGAGPSGTTAARKCALNGLNTLIIEKEKLPRYKVCAGGITERAVSLLDFKIDDKLIERKCNGIRIYYNEYTVSAKTKFRMVTLTYRDKFDMFLLRKAMDAGAEVRDSEKVKSLSIGKDRVIIKTRNNEYRAKAVIGADGVNSLVAKYVRAKFKPKELALCLEAEIPIDNNVGGIRDLDIVSAYFGYTFMGYGWVFPKRENLSVGVAGRLLEFKNPESVFRKFLRDLKIEGDVRYHAHMLPYGGYDRRVYSDRILLVGDAAGFVDPLTGEGILYAINSGKIAADVIMDAHEEDDFSVNKFGEYARICHNAFGSYLRDTLRVSLLVHKYPNIFFRTLTRNNDLLLKFLEVQAGKTDYREFRRWLLIRMPYYGITGHIMT